MNRRLFALSCVAMAAAPPPATASVRSRLRAFRRRAWRSRLGVLGLLALAIGVPLYVGSVAAARDDPRPWDER
jgi:hypothetical protein